MTHGHSSARIYLRPFFTGSLSTDYWNYQTELTDAVRAFHLQQPGNTRKLRKLLCNDYILISRVNMTILTIEDARLGSLIVAARDPATRRDYLWYRTAVCQVAMGLKALDLPVLLVLIIAHWTAEASNRMIYELPKETSWKIAKLVKHKNFEILPII